MIIIIIIIMTVITTITIPMSPPPPPPLPVDIGTPNGFGYFRDEAGGVGNPITLEQQYHHYHHYHHHQTDTHSKMIEMPLSGGLYTTHGFCHITTH